MMKVKYISHSGFLIETSESVYIFDYYNGTLPDFDSKKPVVVFSSHAHHDHYNPEIFEMLKVLGITNFFAVLSDDISAEKLPVFQNMLVVHGGCDYTLPGGEKIRTFYSTDEGVAFLLQTDEGTIFHSGDLNDWRWEGESDEYNSEMAAKFCTEINKLKDIHIDCAFVPLDPRQEGYTGRGFLYFLENVMADNVYPMHYWGKPEVIADFTNSNPQFSHVIRNTENI